VSGWSYGPVPASFGALTRQLQASGLVSSTVTRLAQGPGAEEAALVVATYAPRMVPLLDSEPASTVMSGAAAAITSSLSGGVVTDRTLSGVPVREVSSASDGVVACLAYVHGGHLVVVFAGDARSAVDFTTAYLAVYH